MAKFEMHKIKQFSLLLIISTLAVSCFKEDNVAPRIVLREPLSPTVLHGFLYEEPGFTATDNKDGDVSYLVDVKGEVNSEAAGIYYLKYNVSDASGNKAREEVRTVFVSHHSESLSGIYKAYGSCLNYYIDNDNYYVTIDKNNGNLTQLKIVGLINIPKNIKVSANLYQKTGVGIQIPAITISDTLYSGSGTVNALGNEINLTIIKKKDNFYDTCTTRLSRFIR
jgi:hypothetical protein